MRPTLHPGADSDPAGTDIDSVALLDADEAFNRIMAAMLSAQ